MESQFGHDFSRVRVHDDARAAASTRALDARAWTLGRDIAFADSEFRPSTPEGRTLIAHELTHVVQQARQSRRASPEQGMRGPDGPMEAEAERLSERFAQGKSVAGMVSGIGDARALVQAAPRKERGAATRSATVAADRPLRPSDPATQMSKLLAKTKGQAVKGSPGHCYAAMKQCIKAAGGYGDILNIYKDERFVPAYATHARQFADAVEASGAANMGLEVVSGSPLAASAGTLLVTRGGGNIHVSKVSGDIAVIGSQEGSTLTVYNDGTIHFGNVAKWEPDEYHMYKPVARPGLE